MEPEIDIRQLAALFKAKRGKRGLRTVAEEIGGVSASTLSRVEQGKLPDLDTFVRICRWLEVSTDRFLPSTENAPQTVPQLIVAHLRADRNLDPSTAEALVTMIQLAYAAVERGELGQRTQERQA
jgi:transcriptional regulator with XRE-family HTH domain